MAALDTSKLAFFFRNRCATDGIWGNAELSANVADGGTLDNIFHKSLLRYAQLDTNDVTITVQLRDNFRDVQAIHIIADLTSAGVITISSRNTVGDSYVVRKTLTLGTLTSGGLPTTLYENPEERIDPPLPIYSVYFTASEQSTVAGHAWWTIKLTDTGRSATASIPVRKLYFGPITQFLTLPGDGAVNTFTKEFFQEGTVIRTYGAPHSNPTPVLQRYSLTTQARTTTEKADLEYDLARLGLQRPFFFAMQPNQGTILDATNYAEKWTTLYGMFSAPPRLEYLPGGAGLVQLSASILESR